MTNEKRNHFAVHNNKYIIALFIFCLVFHIVLSFVGWNNTLSDHHGFRQTQTAISTYYLLKEGIKFNYITPVLGKPWEIPMEFPLFQWIVAGTVRITKMNLDQAGRAVSLFFFYLSLLPVFYLTGYFVERKTYRLIFLSILLACPIYLFWSRTFLIESLALFLCLAFLAFLVRAVNNQEWYYLVIACFFATLAGLTKMTSFIAFCPAAAILLLVFFKKKIGQSLFTKKVFMKFCMHIIVLFVIPLFINILWIRYADFQKSLNPIAINFITSKALFNWNFGDLFQRLELETWTKIYSMTVVNVWGRWIIIPLVCLFSIFLNRKHRSKIILSFLFFLWSPLVFVNLYYVHDYYVYANAIFMLFAMGFAIVNILEFKKKQSQSLVKYIILPLVILSLFHTYATGYFRLLVKQSNNFEQIAEILKQHTKEEDIILVYGFDWSPEIPYYSERKAIMVRFGQPFTTTKLESALDKLENDKIGAMVVGCRVRGDEEFKTKYINKLCLSTKPVSSTPMADIYIAKSLLEN